MTTSSVAGKPLLGAELTQPYLGAWHVEVEAASETALSGKVTTKIDDVAYVGTVVVGRSGVHGGRAKARIVGGNGGLSKTIGVIDYAGPAGAKLSMVVSDILRDAGETLSPTSDQAILSKVLTKWHRIESIASHALTRVCEAAGAHWRVLADGTIWIGVTAWPVVKPKHVLIDEDWIAGIITIATEAPALEPGVTFLDQRIDTVVHVLTPTSLRTEAHLTSPSSALNKFLAYIRRQVDYSRPYPATVSKQNDDETLQLVPDDARVKGSGLDRAQIRPGIPGITSIKVPAGTRCKFEWEAGDPARPIVTSFEPGSHLLIQLGAAALPAARQGDMVAAGGAGAMILLTPIPGSPPSPTLSPGVPYLVSFGSLTNPPTPAVQGPLYGAVISGNQQTKL